VLEKTLFLIKPDGVSRGLEKEIFSMVERAGLKIEASRTISLSLEEAARLYQPHLGKEFYPGLIKFITSGPVEACLVSGDNAISRMRQLMGDTDPRSAKTGTIRGDLREENVINDDGIIKNLVHGSDSAESAAREINIFYEI